MIGEQTLTGVRYAEGEYVDGDWVDGASSSITLVGVIQPLADRELMQLPEAWRTRARWKLYTTTRLKPVDVDDQTKGDRINWDGTELLVAAERNFYQTPKAMRLRHFRYVLIEREVPDE